MRKICFTKRKSIRNLKILKYHIYNKTLLFSSIFDKYRIEDEKYLKKKNQFRY